MSVPWIVGLPLGMLVGLAACLYLAVLVWSLEHIFGNKGWQPPAILWVPIVIGLLIVAGLGFLSGFGVTVS